MTHPPPTLPQPLSLSEIEKLIVGFNTAAITLLAQREKLVDEMVAANLGKRFAQRSLASVIVKMPEGR